jgi:hypothetical protein
MEFQGDVMGFEWNISALFFVMDDNGDVPIFVISGLHTWCLNPNNCWVYGRYIYIVHGVKNVLMTGGYHPATRLQ